MPKPLGGRGIEAPYETTHVRVPVPIKPQVEKLIDDYRSLVLNENAKPDLYKECASAMTIKSYSEAVEMARQILRQKKSARESLEKMLAGLYGGEISLK
jgi:hypothetical protein